MTLGNTISFYRRKLNITQEGLAQQLNVSNQAVSKWESNQCCPDISLLPALADLFQISMDELFGRAQEKTVSGLPWSDQENVLHAVLYLGHKLVGHERIGSKNDQVQLGAHPMAKEITFVYEGLALDVRSDFSVQCGDVAGRVVAGGNVTCGSIGGDTNAGGNIECDDIGGDADAGGSITCGDVSGDVNAGSNIKCGDIGGDADAGASISCRDIGGDAEAGTSISCDNIGGDADAIRCVIRSTKNQKSSDHTE